MDAVSFVGDGIWRGRDYRDRSNSFQEKFQAKLEPNMSNYSELFKQVINEPVFSQQERSGDLSRVVKSTPCNEVELFPMVDRHVFGTWRVFAESS